MSQVEVELPKKLKKVFLDLKASKERLDEYLKRDKFRRTQAEKLLQNVNEKGVAAVLAVEKHKSVVTDANKIAKLEKLVDSIASTNDEYIKIAEAACAQGIDDLDESKTDMDSGSVLKPTVDIENECDAAKTPEAFADLGNNSHAGKTYNGSGVKFNDGSPGGAGSSAKEGAKNDPETTGDDALQFDEGASKIKASEIPSENTLVVDPGAKMVDCKPPNA